MSLILNSGREILFKYHVLLNFVLLMLVATKFLAVASRYLYFTLIIFIVYSFSVAFHFMFLNFFPLPIEVPKNTLMFELVHYYSKRALTLPCTACLIMTHQLSSYEKLAV